MPTPNKNESEADFVERCIPIVIDEGTAKDGDQAAAICHSMYKQHQEKKGYERRTYPVSILEVRESAETKARKIIGHAAVFNVIGDGGWFREKVSPGAFASSIPKDDIRATFNHNPDYVLGRNTAGTLTLSEDERGLFTDITPPDTQFARDLMTSIERGDITQMSFAFQIIREGWETAEGEKDLRIIQEARLWDVAVVTYPFYTETGVAVRSHNHWRKEERKREPLKTDILRKKLELLLKESQFKIRVRR